MPDTPTPLADEDLADLTAAYDAGLLAVVAWATSFGQDCYDAGLVAGSLRVDPKRHGGLS